MGIFKTLWPFVSRKRYEAMTYEQHQALVDSEANDNYPMHQTPDGRIGRYDFLNARFVTPEVKMGSILEQSEVNL